MLKKVSRFFKKLKRKSINSEIICYECKGYDTNAIDCSICLEHIHKNNKSLVCGHSFHIVCINSWLAVNFNCPICRRNPNEPIIIPLPSSTSTNGGSSMLHNVAMLHDVVIFASLIAGACFIFYKILF